MLASGEGKKVGVGKKSSLFSQPGVQSEKREAVADKQTRATSKTPHLVSLSQSLSGRRYLPAPGEIRGGPELRQRWSSGIGLRDSREKRL